MRSPLAVLASLLRQPDGYVEKVGNELRTTTSSPGGGGASTLAGLSDVSLASPAEGDVLTFAGTVWVNEPPT